MFLDTYQLHNGGDHHQIGETLTRQITNMTELSEYEKQRLENIKKNNELLKSLGLDQAVLPEKQGKGAIGIG